MSEPTFGPCFDNEMDDIVPDDSISRGGIASTQAGDHQDDKVSSVAARTAKTAKSDQPPSRSALIFVKDDKYESNVDYLKGLMGVFQALL